MFYTKSSVISFFFLVMCLGFSCSEEPPPAGTTGKEGQACHPNFSCDVGLACRDKKCVPTQSTLPGTSGSDKFSFFVASLEAMQKLSKSKDGFGGNLGGLEGADKICQTIAEGVGAGKKTWRAFLSVTKGPDGKPVHAKDRIGKGPWHDRNGRLVASDLQSLISDRPKGDAQIAQDLPNEHGQAQKPFGDNHDILTGTNKEGKLANTDPASTCKDWTATDVPGSSKKVTVGHSWPGGRSGTHWIESHTVRGCLAGINLKQDGRGTGDCVGCNGGYGGIYCFAVTP